jgi:hypothetical protein
VLVLISTTSGFLSSSAASAEEMYGTVRPSTTRALAKQDTILVKDRKAQTDHSSKGLIVYSRLNQQDRHFA